MPTGPASIAAIVRHLGVCRFRIGSGSARLVGSSRVRACSSDARQSVSTVDLPIPSCVSAKADSGRCTRHRWIGNSATTRALQGRRMARFSSGSRLGKARTLSTYLDSLRETAASQGIERVVNGSLDTRAIGVNSPTVEVQDFVYDIDFRERPKGSSFPLVNAPDPFELVARELSSLSDGIKSLIGTDHPVLNAAAKYFFDLDGGKKIRPTMVILVSHACNNHARQLGKESSPTDTKMREALQLRLAEITEMIHAASLFHDDVIDEADTRRGVPSVNKVFGNKLAILAGDFLLARSSMSLARLRSLESVELMSAAIEHLVKGEVLQMRPAADGGGAFEYYVRKNYYKTGSLMANSCKAGAVLGNHDIEVQGVAFEYGKRVGLAFQLVDDILDFEGNPLTLGKPALSDLRQGLATAPVLLAADQQPGLLKLIKRKFKGPGDVDEALALVNESDGIARAKEVAVVQAEKAMDAVLSLHESQERDALVQLAYKIVNRNH